MLELSRAIRVVVTASNQVKILVHFPQLEPQPIVTTYKPPGDSRLNLLTDSISVHHRYPDHDYDLFHVLSSFYSNYSTNYTFSFHPVYNTFD
jgi:hypothetical protein